MRGVAGGFRPKLKTLTPDTDTSVAVVAGAAGRRQSHGVARLGRRWVALLWHGLKPRDTGGG
jgi:hypothetical protein